MLHYYYQKKEVTHFLLHTIFHDTLQFKYLEKLGEIKF